MTQEDKDQYWELVERTLGVFSIAPHVARPFRHSIETLTPAQQELFYHVEPFDIARDLAEVPDWPVSARAAYELLVRQRELPEIPGVAGGVAVFVRQRELPEIPGIEVTVTAGVIVVGLRGRLTYQTSNRLSALREYLVSIDRPKVVFDLGDVLYIDSTGLYEIIKTHTEISRRGGELRLANLPTRVRDLFRITNLHTAFDWVDGSVAAAVRALNES